MLDGRELAIEAHDKGRNANIDPHDPKRAMGLLRRFYNCDDVASTLFQYVGEQTEFKDIELQKL